MTALVLAFALLLPVSAYAQTRVNAALSQENVRVGETVVLAISVETSSSADVEIKLPQLANTIVVIGSQESSQIHFAIPGGRRRVVTRELMLQPASQGTFTIPAIDIEVGGVAHRTRPLTLRVTAAAVASPGMTSTEAWLRVSMSPDTVYVGQQTTLTAEAGFSEEVRLRLTRPPIFDTPSPTGFWVQDIPGGVRSQLRTVDNRVVEVQTKKIAYFPLSAGRFALKQVRVIVDVRQGFLYAPETREMRSGSPRLTVLPLPETDKPATFRGAVGSYSMQSAVEPLSVAAGEPVQVRLEITGTGNVKAVAAPTLPQVLGAETFAPTEESVTRIGGETVGGTKTFNYVLIPERAGVLAIPAITFSFFDPAARTYRSVKTEPVQVSVLPSGAATSDDPDPGVLRPLRTEPSSSALRWAQSKGFALLQLLPLLVIAAMLLGRRRIRRVDYAGNYLARIRASASVSNEAVYRELDQIVRQAMAEPAANPEVVTGRAAALLQRIESARFAPVTPPASERAAIVRETEQVVKDLFAGRTRRAGVFAVMLIAATQQPITDGVQAYERADYRTAVAAFERQTAATPQDASAWYNLGNAYYRTAERGRAIRAWAQALQLEPRSDDVVHNLRAVGSVEPIRVRPPLAVTAAEWFLMAALLWWIAALIVIVALARKRAITPWAAAPLLLAGVLAITGWRAAHPPQYAIALSDQIALHSEPTVRSSALRHVRAGAVMTVEEEREEWLRVRTIDNREAWVARDELGLLNPKSAESAPAKE
jgi:tetratricopeptide (TPR) repeat protein